MSSAFAINDLDVLCRIVEGGNNVFGWPAQQLAYGIYTHAHTDFSQDRLVFLWSGSTLNLELPDLIGMSSLLSQYAAIWSQQNVQTHILSIGLGKPPCQVPFHWAP